MSVGVRVRPLPCREKDMEFTKSAWTWHGKTLTQQIFPAPACGAAPKRSTTAAYTFDNLYPPESTSSHIYDTSRVVEDVLEGYNGLVGCYGQSQSGKSLTIAAMTIHTVQDIFSHIHATAATTEYLLRLTYVQVHDEKAIDLLKTTSQPTLFTQRNLDGSFALHGCTSVPIVSADHALALVETGRANQAGGGPIIESQNKNCLASPVHSTILDLVDLAASESVSPGAMPMNKSLLAFGHIVWQYSHNPTASVPYEDSALTQLLQPTLTLSASMALLCTVVPIPEALDETHRTLKARRIELRLQKPMPHGPSTFLAFDRHLEKLISQRDSENEIEAKVQTELEIRKLRQVILNRDSEMRGSEWRQS
ncbi:kinesin-like protein [Achlya hypogyna]|uniref:Kinesin-like protein n=1 Tax=Achlya hypogyna TaxID=1202772 RepID=A0A1V9ZTW0_ACHHY|nr:kinesin-like protein [Achlya hypogyna]